MPPVTGFLAIGQAEMNISGYDRPIPNGNGGTSALCEACHGVGNNPAMTPFGDPWSSSELNVNPGLLGTYSHPIDSYPASTDAAVESFPDAWPVGDSQLASTNVSPVPICESCHTPHPQAALQNNRLDVESGAGPYILRSSNKGGGFPLCDICHWQTVPNHHPINKKYNSIGVSYLENTTGTAGDNLSCSACHSYAHGWKRPGWVALDASWLPEDNGRGELQLDDMYNPDMSKTCMDCHYFMDGDGNSVSPTMGASQTVILSTDDEYAHFQTLDKNSSTHYIGLIHEKADNWYREPLVDIFSSTETWLAQSTDPLYSEGLAPGWARFGGEDSDGSRVLVCESCHELEPDKNKGFKHLLLAPYEDGQNGFDEYPGDSDGHDILCEVCHGIPSGTHPISHSIVSRSSEPIDTNAKWLRRSTLGYVTMDRSKDLMSCDSCHQPHDANSESFTFILDAPDIVNVGSNAVKAVAAGVVEIQNPAEVVSGTLNYPTANGDFSTYSTPTLVGRGGDYTGFCEQCHYYAYSEE